MHSEAQEHDQIIKKINVAIGEVEESSDFELISKEVMKAISKDDVIATPNNYKIYYHRFLEEKSKSFVEQLNHILEFEQELVYDKSFTLEKSLTDGQLTVRSIEGVSESVGKNSFVMLRLLQKRAQELKNSNSSQLPKVKASLISDTAKFKTFLENKIEVIHKAHSNITAIIKSVENETIFDHEYNMHNRRYLMRKLELEVGAVKELKHKSVLIAIKLEKELISLRHSDKIKFLMKRTAGRVILKSSRMDDIVCHYGDGIFMLILKHTNTSAAGMIGQKFIDLVKNTNIFVEDEEIALAINIVIKQISATKSAKEHIKEALDTFRNF